MSKKEERKLVASINIYDEGDDNYTIEANAQVGGLNLTFSRTTEEIRDFFTRRRGAQDGEQKSPNRLRRGLTSVE